ncbi:acyltransferase family protein [Sphingobium mellinum]|uniref:acyltransferase family protein n=1 Tax=Sphingobium mellinum TaxID=1387166 RepID=UPI0030EB371F
MAKNPSIDLLKGVLILLVMGGHVMELCDARGLALWVGSGLRMPLMIGISGYLLNVTRTREVGPLVLLRRYGRRMLLPWVVAVLIYAILGHARLSWAAPVDLLLRPPFHLWYVPVLFFFILLTRLLPFPPVILLMLGAPVSLAVMYSFGLGHGPVGDGLFAPDSRFLRYPVYFFFGMLLAERTMPPRMQWLAWLITGLGLCWWSALYATGSALAYVPARLLMCLGLIALLPIVSARRLEMAPVNAIGRDSLFFYLWHPLVIGAMMMTGIGPLATLALSILMLAIARPLLARSALLSLLLGVGGVKVSRSALISPPPPVPAST